jgi:hypothetical protein
MLAATVNVFVVVVFVTAVTVVVVIAPVANVAPAFVLPHPLVLVLHQLVVACLCPWHLCCTSLFRLIIAFAVH